MNLETLYLRFVFDGKDVNRGLKDLKRSLKDIQNIGSRQLFRTFAKLASVVGFTKMTLDATSFARSMTYLAQKTGVASSKLSNMKTAFDRVNGSGDQAVKLVERISKGIAGAKFGDYKTISQLSKMGIGYKGRSPQDIMFSMADWANRQVSSGKLSMPELTALFEKEFSIGAEFTSLMAGGSGNLRKYLKESSEALADETDEEIKKRNALSNAIKGLNASFDRLKNKIISELAPALTKIVDVFADLIGWCTKHSELSAIVTALIGLFTSLSALKWVLGIGTLLKSVAASAGVATTAIAGVSGALATAAAVLIPLVSLGAAGYAGFKLLTQKTVRDAEYWDESQKKYYIENRLAGMTPEQAHKEAEEMANIGRKSNKLKTKHSEASSGSDLDKIYRLPTEVSNVLNAMDMAKTLPAVYENAANPIINDVDVDVEVKENPDGTYTTETSVNGQTITGGKTSSISVTQVSTDGGPQ